MVCDYCESSFEVAQIEAHYAAKQSKADASAVAAAERAASGEMSAFEAMGATDGVAVVSLARFVERRRARRFAVDDMLVVLRGDYVRCNDCGFGMPILRQPRSDPGRVRRHGTPRWCGAVQARQRRRSCCVE